LSVFKCECCLDLYPDIHQHIHHRIPRSLGGLDTPSNLVKLCPGCHDTLHNIAYKLLNKKFSQASVIDSLKLIYKDNGAAQKNCLELAVIVRDSVIKGRESVRDPDSLCGISTTLRRIHKNHVTIRCRELNLSQEDYVRGLILSDIKKRFGLALDVPSETIVIKRLKQKI